MVEIKSERIVKLKKRFENRFQTSFEDVFSSPGRIEICGNHTDHNNGKVLVGAIDCDMVGLTSKSDDVVILSEGYPEIAFPLSEPLKKWEEGTTIAMVKGVIDGFKKNALTIGGFHLVMDSEIFKGAGISSSAAFELLICEILNVYYNCGTLDRMLLAKIGRHAENEFFKKPTGLLDQSGISLGGVCQIDFEKEPKVQKISANFEDYEIVIVNSGDHSNLTSEYAKIREDMAEASKFFGKKVLREVDEKEFYSSISTLKGKISGRSILRACHFFEENHRVEKSAAALKKGDMAGFLKEINASGLSSELYLQNTTYPADRAQNLVLALKLAKDLVGNGATRVHGGGFAGTIIAFIKKDLVENFVAEMSKVFGKENILVAKVRDEGATKVNV